MAADSPVHIGTCGFSYPEWIEADIYPSGTKSAQMLALYGHLFAVVELNDSWQYQMIRRIPRMRAACASGVILFNNHVAGQAVANARAMVRLVR